MEEPVTIIDRDVLKVLSVDTRMDILKILSEGERTPSFIGKKLDKSDATIVEHLEKLEKVGLVKRIEQPGKKWVFYTLTERGYGIITSKSRRLVIILVSSTLALLGGFVSFAQFFYQSGQYDTFVRVPLATEVGKDATEVAIVSTPIFLYIAIGLFAISLIGFSFYLIKKSKFKEWKYE
jgi:DNA-binding transcriptional ArsR family regulator